MISDSILVTESIFTQLVTPLVTELVTQSPGRGRAQRCFFTKFTILKLFFHYLVNVWYCYLIQVTDSVFNQLVTQLVTQSP